MTAVAGGVFTAADFNTFVRDNLNETAVAKATTAGRIFVSTGLNELAERVPASDTNNTLSITTSTSYGDLNASSGPVVTARTGSSALVFWSARVTSDTAGQVFYVSPYVSGASTVAASDNWAFAHEIAAANDVYRSGAQYMFTGLTPGVNNFGLQYKVGNGTGTFVNSVNLRHIFVIPL